MIALYTSSIPREIKISGTADEWSTFAKMVCKDRSEIVCEMVENPSPYSSAAPKIVIYHNDAKRLSIDVNEEGNIFVAGSPEASGELSKAIFAFANEFHSGEHYHIDYQGHKYFVAEGSSSTVLYME